jgi:outer membrane protein insertion porin family
MKPQHSSYLKYLLSFVILVFSCSSFSEEINEVVVKGNKRIEEATIISYSEIEYGADYNSKDLDKIINKLYKQGMFKKINVYIEEDKLFIELEENPLVKTIHFPTGEGDSIKAEIPLKEGNILNSNLIEKSKKIIERRYKAQGYYGSKVKYFTTKQDQNRVDVSFEVKKGKHAKIKNIYFVGNSYFPASKLKKVIASDEANFLSAIIPQPEANYKKSRIEYDKNLLESFYNDNGFANFKVKSVNASLADDKQNFVVTYNLDEGDVYELVDWEINLGKTIDIDKESLKKHVNLKTGEDYRQANIDNAKSTMIDELRERGYAFADIDIETNFDYQNRKADIKFNVNETNKLYIGNIALLGNKKTYDHVIRREMLISEGDPFIHSRIQKSIRNIYGLGYFSNLTPNTKQNAGNEDNVDLDIELEEASTTDIGATGSWSSEGGVSFDLSFNEKNLLGRGYKFNTSLQYTVGGGTNFDIGVVNPYLMGNNLLLGSNFNVSNDNTDDKSLSKFNKKNKDLLDSSNDSSNKNKLKKDIFKPAKAGFKTFLGYNIIEDLNQQLVYNLKAENLKLDEELIEKKVSNQVAKNENIRQLYKESEQKRIISLIKVNTTYNRLDNMVSPKHGFKISNQNELAGLGGNTYYYKSELNLQKFTSFYDDIFRLELDLDLGFVRGWHGHTTNIADRFELGFNSFRGFDRGGVGPRVRDKSSIFHQKSLRGKNKAKGSAEIDFPIGSSSGGKFGVRGAFFLDVGATWDIDIPDNLKISKDDIYLGDHISASLGVGFSIQNPFAPIRIDFGLPLRKSEFDKTNMVSFSMNAKL